MNKLFLKRHSIRQFLPKKVNNSQIKDILFSAMIAPSGYNFHPLDYVVVNNKQLLKKLAFINGYPTFDPRVPLAIILVADPSQGPKHWLIDASIAAAHIYLETTNQELGTCWIDIYENDTENGIKENRVKQLLKLPKEKRVICIMPIGYPNELPSDHDQSEYNEGKIHQNRW